MIRNCCAQDGIHWDEGSSTPWFRYVAQYVQTPCGPPVPPTAPPSIPENCTEQDGTVSQCPATHWCRTWQPAQIREVPSPSNSP